MRMTVLNFSYSYRELNRPMAVGRPSQHITLTLFPVMLRHDRVTGRSRSWTPPWSSWPSWPIEPAAQNHACTRTFLSNFSSNLVMNHTQVSIESVLEYFQTQISMYQYRLRETQRRRRLLKYFTVKWNIFDSWNSISNCCDASTWCFCI